MAPITAEQVDDKIAAALAPIAAIEIEIKGILDQLRHINNLHGRVANLETWKANLNGHAQALAEVGATGSNQIYKHHRAGEDLDHLSQRLTDYLDAVDKNKESTAKENADEVAGAKGDKIVFNRTMIILAVGFVLLLVLLAAISGERGREVLPKNPIDAGKVIPR